MGRLSKVEWHTLLLHRYWKAQMQEPVVVGTEANEYT